MRKKPTQSSSSPSLTPSKVNVPEHKQDILRYSVMYTKHINQKQKKWEDGRIEFNKTS